MANDAFSKAVNLAILEEQYKLYEKMYGMKKAIKAHLNTPNPLWPAATNQENHHKEKPMSATMTMNQIGQAKKQRDVLRNRFRTDIQKFSEKFGVSNFEAAHAIMDSVLNQYNDYAKNYGTCEMKHNLAQTLLPDTLNLIGGSGTITSPGETPIWHAGPLFTQKQKAGKGKLISSKPKGHGLAKLDKDVTEADLDGTYIVEYGQNQKTHNELLKNYKETDDQSFYLSGSKYIYGGALSEKFGGMTGSIKVIWKMSKAAPYINTSDAYAYNLSAPQGFKFRKLKNKPFYKLIKDAKQSYYWNKVEAAAVTAPDINETVPANVDPDPVHYVGGVPYAKMTSTQGYESFIQIGKAYATEIAKKFPNVPDGYGWIKTSNLQDTMALVKVEAKPVQVEPAPSIYDKDAPEGMIKASDSYGFNVNIKPNTVYAKWLAEEYSTLSPGYVWVPNEDGGDYQAKKVDTGLVAPQSWAKNTSPALLGWSSHHWETYLNKPTHAILMPEDLSYTHIGKDGQKYSSAKAEFPYNHEAGGTDF